MRRLLLTLAILAAVAPRLPFAGAATAQSHAPSPAVAATGTTGGAHTTSTHARRHRKVATPKHAKKDVLKASGLAGIVRHDHKRPLTGATLTCTRERRTWHAHTDKRGSFYLRLAPGRYTCTATARGYKQATEKAAIKAHQVAHISFSITAANPRHGHAAPTPTGPTFTLPTEGPTPPSTGPTGGETCTWTSTQALYVDTNATYWATALRADPTVLLTIAGAYPAARYVSLQVYSAQGAYLAGLADKNFPADPGTANPFASSHAKRGTGRYTLHLIFGSAPSQPVAGTLYVSATPGDTVVLVYRVYLPDLAADQKGNVALPAVTAVSLATGSPIGCPLPAVSFPVPVATTAPISSPPVLTGTVVATATAVITAPLASSTSVTATTPLPFATPTPFHTPSPLPPAPAATPGFTRLSGDQLGGYNNPDAAYLVSPLPPRLGVYVIRFKPPTTPHTLSGEPLDANAQVRYWSICVYSVIGPFSCTADEQAQLDSNGQLTVVLGATWARPPNVSSLSGVIWIDLGTLFIAPYKVIIRELLPSPRFSSSIFAVPLGAAPDSSMGAYAPTLTECSTAQFQATLCA